METNAWNLDRFIDPRMREFKDYAFSPDLIQKQLELRFQR
jgi:hypothetical protein